MTEDYGARLAREWTERQDRMARTLYEAWHEMLFARSYHDLSDMEQEKWRRLARVAIAEASR